MKQTIKLFLFKKRFFKEGLKVLKNKKGFSLIEIMVALGLLVVIGGITGTQYNTYTTKARKQAINSSLGTVVQAVSACVAIEGNVATCLANANVNNTVQAKTGIKIVRSVGTNNTCFYALEEKTNDANSASVPIGRYYGKRAFKTSDASRVTSDDLTDQIEAATAHTYACS